MLFFCLAIVSLWKNRYQRNRNDTGKLYVFLFDPLFAKEDRNIILLHGQVSDTMGMDRIYLRRLRNKQIDYLALGHVHKHQEGKLDDRGKYAYSGCLEGRGFDEIGEHGFILLTVEDEIKTEFIPFQERLIVEEKVDISAASDAYSAAQLVKKFRLSKNGFIVLFW